MLAVGGALTVVLASTVLHLRENADPESHWQAATAALHAGRLDEAEAGLRRVAARRSPTARDLLLQAQLAGLRGHDDEAIRLADLVPDTDPMATLARLFVARAERQRGRLRAAEQAFLRALRLDPRLVEARKGLIYIYGVQFRRLEVHEQFLALSKLTSLTPRDLVAWEHTHFSGWDNEIAKDLSAFLKADPADRETRLALAEVSFTVPDLRPRVLEILAPLPSGDPDADALRARLALEDGRTADAESLLAGGPSTHPGLERMRGRSAMTRKDYKGAALHLRRSIRPGSFDRSAYFMLAQALRLSGDEEGAAEATARYQALSHAHDLIDGSTASRDRRGARDLLEIAEACEQAELFEEARQWYLQSIRLNPVDIDAQTGLDRCTHRWSSTTH